MPTKKERQEMIFSPFQDQKLRVLKASKEVEYHFAVAQKGFDYERLKEQYGSKYAEDLSDFYFKVESVLYEIRKDRLFSESRKALKSHSVRFIAAKDFGLFDAVKSLKSAVADLIDLFVSVMGKSIFIITKGPNGRIQPSYTAQPDELKGLADVMNLHILDQLDQPNDYSFRHLKQDK